MVRQLHRQRDQSRRGERADNFQHRHAPVARRWKPANEHARHNADNHPRAVPAQEQQQRTPGAFEEKPAILDDAGENQVRSGKERQRQPGQLLRDQIPSDEHADRAGRERSVIAHPRPQRGKHCLPERQDHGDREQPFEQQRIWMEPNRNGIGPGRQETLSVGNKLMDQEGQNRGVDRGEDDPGGTRVVLRRIVFHDLLRRGFGTIRGQGESFLSEVRGQRSEVRGQGSEVRGQRSGVRGQGSEVRGQRSGVRGQGSEVRGQRSGVRGQRSGVRGFGTWLVLPIVGGFGRRGSNAGRLAVVWGRVRRLQRSLAWQKTSPFRPLPAPAFLRQSTPRFHIRRRWR